MRILAAIAALFVAVSFSSFAQAQQDIRLGQPGYGGSGCPGGSADVVLAPDKKSLSILFDEYYVEAGGTTGKSFERKTCNIAIPVRVPQGLSISIIAVDYRGFNDLPSGARSTFDVEYFFAGTAGPKFQRTFNGPRSKDYRIRNELQATALVWSKCGESVNLRTNSSIRVQTTGNKQAVATVDSQDVSAAIVYLIQWKKC